MTEQTPTKLLNKGFISITVINFIVYLVYYLLMVIIAVIAQDSLHATLGQAVWPQEFTSSGHCLHDFSWGNSLN